MDIDFSALKKKKKKRKKDKEVTPSLPISESLEYGYRDLLKRVYEKLGETHATRVKKIIQAPQVVYQNKRSVVTNFGSICKTLNRDANHVMLYMMGEFGANATIDSCGQFIIRGKFKQRDIEVILRRYIVEFVACKECKCVDTTFTRINKLNFVKCSKCGSTKTVPALKMDPKIISHKKK